MKRKMLIGAVLALATVIVLDCGRKKSTNPVGSALDTASEAIKKAPDAKAVATALEALAATVSPMVEQNANLLTDRTPFKESADDFISAYAEAMVKYMGNEDINAAEKKLPKGILF